MSDITICLNSHCPSFLKCYRAQAVGGRDQSYTALKPPANRKRCDSWIPMKKPAKFVPASTEPISPGNIEYRPASMIAKDCQSKGQAPIQAKSITQESLIQSYQNGLSRGFSNGLDIACKWLEDNNYPEAAKNLTTFAGGSKDEQFKK